MNLFLKKIQNLKKSLKPYGKLRRTLEQTYFQLCASKGLDALHNCHLGKRCFIVGNGPSLKMLDLSKLKNEITFTTNMFALADMKDTFEPTYYSISDWIHWASGFSPNLLMGIEKYKHTTFFMEYDAKRIVRTTPQFKNRNIHYLFLNEVEVAHGNFQTNIRKPLNWGRSVVIDFCLPIACHMGFSEIYIIGVDFEYAIKTENDVGASYFYDGAKDDRPLFKSPEHTAVTGKDDHIDLVMNAFQTVYTKLNSSHQKVFNAGYQGKLNIFPRVSYETLFEKKTQTAALSGVKI